MQENNNIYKVHNGLRIHTDVLKDKYLNVNINQDVEQLEILSLKIDTDNFYKLHTSNYGCLVGRVLANQGVGIPNVKISVFIPAERADLENPIFRYLYPYTSTKTRDANGIRYNLLPDVVDDKCHQDVGTFPNKRLVLDDDNVIEVFDKYFKYTTVTNASGDYMLFGLPVGNQIIHSELDLSDIGILSQKPRDLFYKGYNHTQFENSSQFKKSTSLDSLTQIFTQDNSVQVYPFWGDDETEGIQDVDSQVKITRNDIDINYKFEPTCIFIGSLVADDKSNGFSKRCTPTERSGKMDRLTTGNGTIEMIRKTPDGYVESINIQGNTLIDGNGTWCYQIPMNLDYVKTDEYGNLVPAENEMTGIPTRTRVRFRASLADYESDSSNVHLPKVLIPNNPTLEEMQRLVDDGNGNEAPQGIDYNFGTYTREESYRDLFWNNVYTVREYIPRMQNIILDGPWVDRNKNFSGFKAVNVNGNNNPIPYNNIRVQLTFLFIFQCIIFKALVLIVKVINKVIYLLQVFSDALTYCCGASHYVYVTLDGSMCPQMEGYYMAIGAEECQGCNKGSSSGKLISGTIDAKGGSGPIGGSVNGIAGKPGYSDTKTIDFNSSGEDKKSSEYKNDPNHGLVPQGQGGVVANTQYFIKCVELQFAMEYEVIQFDFYNDWINGLIYLPRWFAELKRRKRVGRVVACNENYSGNRELVQQCNLQYNKNGVLLNRAADDVDSTGKYHKQKGRIFVDAVGGDSGDSGGIIQTYKNRIDDRYLYYLRPCTIYHDERKLNLFATDIVLLGSVLDCNTYGIPTAVGYPSSTFIMPPPTGQLVSDSQEMGLYNGPDKEYELNTGVGFQLFNKRAPNTGNESDEVEMSGIDWGYNPFTIDTQDDDTTLIQNQVGGHFLEIGCTFSQTTTKTCVNLQRICELGSEMAQSHYYRNGDTGTGRFFSTKGIISAREVIGEDLRTKFAALNSNKLKTVVDTNTGYKMYDFLGYTPYNFSGALVNYPGPGQISWDNLGETTSESYNYFRFCGDKEEFIKAKNDKFINKFLVTGTNASGAKGDDKIVCQIPMYENSFYFYFGLKDGNTAIDRLYVEYFSDCGNNEAEEGEIVNTTNNE